MLQLLGVRWGTAGNELFSKLSQILNNFPPDISDVALDYKEHSAKIAFRWQKESAISLAVRFALLSLIV